jgi:hypothetical protein
MAVKLRRLIIAARFRGQCPERATPQETRTVGEVTELVPTGHVGFRALFADGQRVRAGKVLVQFTGLSLVCNTGCVVDKVADAGMPLPWHPLPPERYPSRGVRHRQRCRRGPVTDSTVVLS